ncbi:MAG TPA: hypothetical protein VFX85_01280 [Solirubrobacterales bacterium]|nr:hypothetical protein [Solirubrobacterales bacterium]
MSSLRRLLLVTCALALLSAPMAVADSGGHAGAPASKKGKKCKHGYKLKTVTRHGKKVKVCGKAKAKGKGKPKPAAPTTPAPAPPQPPAPAGLFEAPGRQLNGEEAKPFLQKYLANSTFTDCPTGWPTCGGFEDRYSHSSDGTFYKCWLRPTSGSDVKSVGEYGVNNSRVEPDGSWIFQETVYWYGNYAAFEWKVAANGVVEGAYQSDPNAAPEKIAPLQYVGGVAKSCSY